MSKTLTEYTTQAAAAASITTVYGTTIVGLVLACSLVTAHDLLPLRAVSRSYRDCIDAKLFQHVRLMTDELSGQTCIVSLTGDRLPGFTPTSYASSHQGGQPTAAVARLKHTSVVDVENVPRNELVHLNRLLTNNGYHTYNPPAIGQGSTMVVFPPFMPALLTSNMMVPSVPQLVTKLVQHLAFAWDCDPTFSGRARTYRDAVLFESPGPRVTKEVWVFTNFGRKVDQGRVGLSNWYDLFSAVEYLSDKLVELTITRIMYHNIDLTLVDGDGDLHKINHPYQLSIPEFDHYPSHRNRSGTEAAMTRALSRGGMDRRYFSNPHMMTWDEYAASLTDVEKDMEMITPEYVKKMEEVADTKLPACLRSHPRTRKRRSGY